MSNTTCILQRTNANQFKTTASVPVYQTTSFEQDVFRVDDHAKANSIVTLKNIISKLNSNKVGIVFGSRLVAIDAVVKLLKAGDEIVIVDNIGNGEFHDISIDERSGVTVNYVSTAIIENVFHAITPRTKLVWIKTSTYSELKISEIQAIAKSPKPAGIHFAWITLLLSNQYNSFLRWELIL